MNKICGKCFISKSIDQFYTDQRNLDKRSDWCKDCWRKYKAKWREKIKSLLNVDRMTVWELRDLKYEIDSALLKRLNKR